MAKHGIEGDPDDYCLVQLIPGDGMYVHNYIVSIFSNLCKFDSVLLSLTCYGIFSNEVLQNLFF